MTEVFIAAVVALAIGYFLGWLLRGLLLKAAGNAYELRLSAAEEQKSEKAGELEALKAEYTQAVQALRTESQLRATAEATATRVTGLESQLLESDHQLTDYKTRLAQVETRLVEERKGFEEKIDLVNKAQVSLSDAFKALSSEALKSNNAAFMDLAKTTLEKFQEGAKSDLDARQKAVDALVKPLQDSLAKVDGKLVDIEKERVSSYSALNEQLRGLVETHLPRLHGETANLVKALRQPSVRGRWGEIQLKRVVEMAGMLEYCDFTQQENINTEEGRLRPDLVVRLPGGKRVVVDAKAPVAAYLDAIESPGEEAQLLGLANHARQVKDHITALGRKSYWDKLEATPEFVILFLPGEMFFSSALQHDPSLIEFGVSQRVIPATPTTLIALLQAVSFGWRQEALAKNAQEISELGKELYKRVSDLSDHWGDVGKHLGKATDAFNRATGTLESRVLVSARRFKELRAAPEGVEMEAVELLDRVPRELQAGEFTGREKMGSER